MKKLGLGVIGLALVLASFVSTSTASAQFVPTTCDMSDANIRFGSITPGATVQLAMHTPWRGDANWSAEMNRFVGMTAVVTSLQHRRAPALFERGCVTPVTSDLTHEATALRETCEDQGLPDARTLERARHEGDDVHLATPSWTTSCERKTTRSASPQHTCDRVGCPGGVRWPSSSTTNGSPQKGWIQS
jgi:hypothetical protein